MTIKVKRTDLIRKIEARLKEAKEKATALRAKHERLAKRQHEENEEKRQEALTWLEQALKDAKAGREVNSDKAYRKFCDLKREDQSFYDPETRSHIPVPVPPLDKYLKGNEEVASLERSLHLLQMAEDETITLSDSRDTFGLMKVLRETL